MARFPAASAMVLAAVLAAGCVGRGGSGADDVCDGAPENAPFVFVQSPRSGEHVESGFGVAGCSRTFEGNVIWRLLARDGSTLASGSTQGGSTSAGRFSFAVRYALRAGQVGRLEVDEPAVTQTEGFPPVRNSVPLVLAP